LPQEVGIDAGLVGDVKSGGSEAGGLCGIAVNTCIESGDQGLTRRPDWHYLSVNIRRTCQCRENKSGYTFSHLSTSFGHSSTSFIAAVSMNDPVRD
jgi:hypothetical protein